MPKNHKRKPKNQPRRNKNNPSSQHSNFGVFDTKAFIFNDILKIPFPDITPGVNFAV